MMVNGRILKMRFQICCKWLKCNINNFPQTFNEIKQHILLHKHVTEAVGEGLSRCQDEEGGSVFIFTMVTLYLTLDFSLIFTTYPKQLVTNLPG